MGNKRDFEEYPLMLRVPEVAEILGNSRASCYNLVKSKGFPVLRAGAKRLVVRDIYNKCYRCYR